MGEGRVVTKRDTLDEEGIGMLQKYVVVTCVETYFFFQAEDGIRGLVRSRGLGDVYRKQP